MACCSLSHFFQRGTVEYGGGARGENKAEPFVPPQMLQICLGPVNYLKMRGARAGQQGVFLRAGYHAWCNVAAFHGSRQFCKGKGMPARPAADIQNTVRSAHTG